MNPYQNVKKVYGPYYRKDGRQHVIIKFTDGSKKTVSYPKYLVECSITRILEDNETVDHFDRDFTNNSLENLFIRDRSIHSSLDNKRVKLITIICEWCGVEIEKKGTYLDNNAKQGKAGPFCNRSCAGKYGAEIQNGRIDKLPRTDYSDQREYYYKDKNES